MTVFTENHIGFSQTPGGSQLRYIHTINVKVKMAYVALQNIHTGKVVYFHTTNDASTSFLNAPILYIPFNDTYLRFTFDDPGHEKDMKGYFDNISIILIDEKPSVKLHPDIELKNRKILFEYVNLL